MGWKDGIKLGIIGWLIALVLVWIIIILVDVSDGIYFTCGLFISAKCDFIGFFFNIFHWIIIMIYTFPAFIVCMIIGGLYGRKVKYWPYWLNGGIIISIIYGMFLVFLILFSNKLSPSIEHYLFRLVNLATLFNCSWAYCFIVGYILTLILYFLIGAVIGWIYGKIKNRNQTQLNQNI